MAKQKSKLDWTETQIFIDPALYKDQKNLPFVGRKSFWDAEPTGDYGHDCRMGKYYALLYLAHIDYCRQTGGFALPLIWIMGDMPKKSTTGTNERGLEVGFLYAIEDRLSITQWRENVTSGVELTVKLFNGRRGDKPLKHDPFIALKKAYTKKKADEQKAAKAKATPDYLRKLSMRLKRAVDHAQFNAISDEIEKLPEPHKKRLKNEWCERSAQVYPWLGMIGVGNQFKATKKRAQA